MRRTILALCASVLVAATGLGANPAAATVTDQEWLVGAGGGGSSVAARSERRSARASRTVGQRVAQAERIEAVVDLLVPGDLALVHQQGHERGRERLGA